MAHALAEFEPVWIDWLLNIILINLCHKVFSLIPTFDGREDWLGEKQSQVDPYVAHGDLGIAS